MTPRGLLLSLIAGVAALPGPSVRAAATPVLVQTSAGRFEFATIDPAAGHAVAALADEMWRHLEKPLGLPAAFSSPVFVRLLPAPGDGRTAAFEINLEPGGVVSLWWRGDVGEDALLRRALVRGLLARLAVAQRGAAASATPAVWLEHACVAWWRARAEGAQLDLARLRVARIPPPPIAGLLDWSADSEPESAVSAAMFWLMTFLQAESGPAGEWPALVRRLIAGMDPQAALAVSYPGRFQGVSARELWWQTGWHHHRRVRVLPVKEAAESRTAIDAFARFVFAAPEGDADRIVPLAEVFARGAEPAVAADLARRLNALGLITTALHPFYLNAGLSLADAFQAAVAGKAEPGKLAAAFERDRREGAVLEEASRRALDALEAKAQATANPDKG
ncbi:MAG: hypothetical protein ACKOE8_06945 [Opitutaceae bacterium]